MAFTVGPREGGGVAQGEKMVGIGEIVGFEVGVGSLYSLEFDRCVCVIAHNEQFGAFIHVEPWQAANGKKDDKYDKGFTTFEKMWNRVANDGTELRVVLIYSDVNNPLVEQAREEGWQMHRVAADKFSVEFNCTNDIRIGG